MIDKGQKGTYVIRGGAVTLAMPGDYKLEHTKKKMNRADHTCTMKKRGGIYGKMVLQVNLR
jgi:hypothetical protein